MSLLLRLCNYSTTPRTRTLPGFIPSQVLRKPLFSSVSCPKVPLKDWRSRFGYFASKPFVTTVEAEEQPEEVREGLMQLPSKKRIREITRPLIQKVGCLTTRGMYATLIDRVANFCENSHVSFEELTEIAIVAIKMQVRSTPILAKALVEEVMAQSVARIIQDGVAKR